MSDAVSDSLSNSMSNSMSEFMSDYKIFKLVFNPVYLVKLEGEEKVDDSDDELSILGDSIVRNIQINKPNLCLLAKVPDVASGIKKIEILLLPPGCPWVP